MCQTGRIPSAIIKTTVTGFAAIMLCACEPQDGTVAMVKGGNLQACPGATVEQMVNGFMGNPSWEAGSSEKSEKFVNVSGDITYAEKPVRAVVQFMVNEKNNAFQYQAFEINGVPQNNLIAMALLSKMCESTRITQSSNRTQAQQEQVSEAAPQTDGDIMSRSELTAALKGKSKAEVIQLLGKPSESLGSEDMLMWTYEEISFDSDTGKKDGFAQVQFMNGQVLQVLFY